MSAAPRLLLVEDDAELRGAVALVLRSRGWEVEAVGSGEEAREALRSSSPRTVVADLSLPDRSGTETVRELRRAAPDARLVVFTGRDDRELRRACLGAGADDFVVKPVAGGELADLLEGS